MLDAAHLLRWSTLTFLCNHWKLWTFVSSGYKFKIPVALQTWLLYSQLFKPRFCTVLTDNSKPTGKSQNVTCRFTKNQSRHSSTIRIGPWRAGMSDAVIIRVVSLFSKSLHHFLTCRTHITRFPIEILHQFMEMYDTLQSLFCYLCSKCYSERWVIDRPACLLIALFLSYLPVNVAEIQAATNAVIWKVTPLIYHVHYEESSILSSWFPAS